jgi:site-specific recombinase XerD
MATPTTPLTQSALKKLTCPTGRKAVQHPIDPQIPGLLVEVRHTGSKTYFLRYRDINESTRYCKIARAMDMTLSEAKKQALLLRAGILLGTYPGVDKQQDSGQCMTFAEFFQQKYLPYATPRKRSIKDDEKLYNHRLKALFGTTRLDKITRHSIQQMHSDLRSELSASSCDHHLGLMSRCLRLAMDWKLITENPAQGLKKYNEDNRRDRLMTDAELQRLMAVLDSDPARTACLVLKMALYTAARKGEILHMRWDDINRQTNTYSISSMFAKGKRRRFLVLSSSALAILDELAQGNTSEWVFLNSKNGERLQSIDKVWQRVRKKADLPSDIVVHSLRHMGASMMLASGSDLATVRDTLGHRDISTSDKYLHTSGKSLREGAEGIESYLEKALAKKAS